MPIIDILSKVAVPVLVPLVAGTVAFWSTEFCLRQRRTDAIDMATKRIAFWDQFLKVAIETTAPDSGERDQLHSEVRAAIQKVRSDANLELQGLSWSIALREKRLPPDPAFGGWRKFSWYALTALAYALILCMVLLIAGLFSAFIARTIPLASMSGLKLVAVCLGAVIFCLLFASSFLIEANKLRYPRPKALVDEI